MADRRRFTSWPIEATINGKPVEGAGVVIPTVDPSTEDLLAEVPSVTTEQVDEAVAAARSAFEPWARTPAKERSRAMHRFADALEARSDDLVDTIVADAGTPISIARAVHVDLAIEHLRWYADAAARERRAELGTRHGPVPAGSTLNLLPTGVVAAIPSYNVPMFLAISKVGASMAAGCTSVVLTPSLTPLMVLLFGEVGRDAELPPGLLNVVAGGPEVGAHLTLHPDIAKVAFTGSVPTGIKVMQQAAQGIKGVVLELGGKSPALILSDADIAPYLDHIHLGYAALAGQACGSLSRILVPRERYDEFVDLSRERYAQGWGSIDPWEPDATIGPMITGTQRDRVEAAVAAAVDSGAEVLAGGGRPDVEKGWFINPVLLGGVASDDTIAQEEVFGPVSSVIPYDGEEEGLRLANDTKYGLNASIIGGDLSRCIQLAPRIQSGTVMINGGGILRPDSHWGGMKQSGIGNEYGEAGIAEYLDTQHVIWPVGGAPASTLVPNVLA